jgi:hypothetical protein
MGKNRQKEGTKILVLSVLIPDNEQVFQNMLIMISAMIHNFQKAPFLGEKEISNKNKEPYTYSWEVKDKASTIEKLGKKIRKTFKGWNMASNKFSLEIKNK